MCAIKDLYNNEIVAYSIGEYQTLELVKRTVTKAMQNKDVTSLIIHSDQGFHFTHKHYIKTLEMKGITASHSRRGNCLDNAPIECFLGHLKSEFPHLYKPKNDIETIRAIKKYIYFYNNERIQVKLKNSSPVNYRTAV